MPSDVEPERRWSRRRKVLLQLALVPCLLLLAELGFRAWARAQGAGYSAARAKEELLGALDAMTQPLPTAPEDLSEAAVRARSENVVHPFLGFDTKVGVRGIPKLLNALAPAVEGGPFRVLIIGGSVSGMVSTSGAEALIAALSADPRFDGRRIVVKNQGRGSFKQPQQLLLVAWLFSLGASPDAIVNIDGFNEVALGAQNSDFGVHPSYPYWPRWGFLTTAAAVDAKGIGLTTRVHLLQEAARGLVVRALSRGYLHSGLLGTLTLRRANRLRLDWTAAQAELVAHLALAGEDEPAKGPAMRKRDPAPLEACVSGWRESSRNLHALCAARGTQYLHVLQPTLMDEGAKPMTEKERAISEGAYDVMRELVREGYPLLRAAGAELAADGVPFLDLSRLFAADESELYVDVCHFRRRGCAQVGGAVGAALLDR